MERERKNITIYLVISAILFVAIKIIEFATQDEPPMIGPLYIEAIVKYLTIVCNTIMTAYFYFKYGRNDAGQNAATKLDTGACSVGGTASSPANLIAYGLFATCAADFFLTLISSSASYLPGLVLFCVVESIYMIYLRSGVVSIAVRTVLLVAGLFALSATHMLSATTAVGVLNMVLIVVNVPQAWLSKKADAPLLFKLGITLFLGCDASIMVRTLTTGTVHDIAAWIVWTCYVPAQILITMSYVQSCIKTEPAA